MQKVGLCSLGLVWLGLACGGRAEHLADSSTAGAAGTAVALGGATGVTAGGSAGMVATAGSAAVTSAGAASGGAASTSACVFGPVAAPAVPPFAPPGTVLDRIAQFVLAQPFGSAVVPSETTPEWAGAQILSLLDKEAGEERAGAGMEDFLQHWVGLAGTTPAELHPLSAPWAYRSGLKDATLTDLITGSALEEAHRVGVFTDPAFLTQKPLATARGAALEAALFCTQLPAPPPNTPPVAPASDGGTYRERLANDTANPVCATCHHVTDELGFALEHYDSTGAYRDLDNGEPIDSSGAFQSPGGSPFMFTSIEQQLAVDLSQSCEVLQCFAETEFEYALRVNGLIGPGETLPPGSLELNAVAQKFSDSGRSLRTLAQAIAESSLFLK
jgi:hypothetical protein